MTQQRRRRISPSEATSRAEEIIPDPALEPMEEAPPRESSTRVDTPPAARAGDVRGPWGVIIDAVLSVDPAEVFARLHRELRIESDEAMTYQVVHLALERADANYFDAARLTRAAKLEEQRIDREIDEKMEVLRTGARAEIESEKRKAAEEVKSKAVGRATAEEVRDRCFANWPDQMNAHERRRDEHHAARAVAEELTATWRSRAASLRELVQGLRGSR